MPANPKKVQTSKGEAETSCDPLAKIDMEDIREFHSSLGEYFHDCILSIPEDVEYGSIVQIYKYYTDQFIARLESMVPQQIWQKAFGKSMRKAAEYVIKEKIKIEPRLLHDLWAAIVYRTRAAEACGGGDAGHFQILKDLRHCMTTLYPNFFSLKPKAKNQVPNERSEDIEIAISSMKVRVDVIVFFMILNELMDFISQQFSVLREVSLAQRQEKQPPDAIIRRMMEVTFAVTFTIHRVAYIERQFVLRHPYLNTVYRMLAVLRLHLPMQYVTNEVRKESPIASEFLEEHAVAFLGDVLESAFRHPSDPQKNAPLLVQEFRQRWQLSDSALGENLINYLDLLVIAEAPLQKQQKSKKLKSFTSAFNITSHSWLSSFAYLGGKRSITHTIRLLQYLSNSVQQGRLAIPKDRLGSSWSDLNKPVSRIQVEMDSLLSEVILPSLVNMCQQGMMSSDPPYEKELLTVFSQIKTFVLYPERPVSWSLAFTVQSILISVYEMQEAHGMLLATTSRQSYQKYFQQLEGVKGKYEATIPRPPPTLNTDIDSMCRFRHLATQLNKRAENVELMALWNPLCAGSFLKYIAYSGNLIGGIKPANCARIKVALHLYNALLQVNAIRPGQVELLSWLFIVFKDCEAMWNGSFPLRGQFQLRWWIVLGLSEEQAAQIQRNSSRKRPGNGDRKVMPIKVELVAKSVRKVCHQNFEDVTISKKSPTKKSTVGNMETFVGYVKDTANAIKENERLLGTNMVVLGYFLNQFYLELFHVCGLMPTVEKYVREAQQEKERTKVQDGNEGNPDSWEESDDCLKYQAMSHVFAVTILRRLDNGDPFLTSKCAAFTIEFFNRIAPRDIMWFSLETKV